jgi:dihydroorotase
VVIGSTRKAITKSRTDPKPKTEAISTRILIQNGRLIDPSQSLDRVTSLLVADGRIAAYDALPSGDELLLDASGKIVAPGLIDMHVHLREPGREEDETIQTGTAAALAGGFTSIACCPNTEPPIDNLQTLQFVRRQADCADQCRVYVMACVSKGRQGKELADIGRLAAAGAVAFSDDGSPVYDDELMRRALECCRLYDKRLLNHAEVPELARGGVVHEGTVSKALGLPGIPAAAEDLMTARDVALAEATGGRLHVMHVSTAGSVDTVRKAKHRGIRVTAECAPHHFTLTDECLRTRDANYKMNPPLRSQEHVDACLAGLIDGTIDAIASDHAPHAREKKRRGLEQAPFGIIGLETTLGLVVTRLVEPGLLDWSRALALLTINPARVLGIPRGTLALGAEADVTIIDPDVRWTVDPAQLRSKSTNTPFAGWELRGRADTVLVGGKVKFSR